MSLKKSRSGRGHASVYICAFAGRVVLWSPGFFSSTVGLNEAMIRRYVDHQERVDKGQMQLEFEF